LHLREGAKALSVPEGARPQAIQLFDVAIAFGFGHWQENEFEADVQTQAHKLSKDARHLVPAAEGGIVVELQKVRDSQRFPAPQEVRDHRRRTLVAGNGLRTGAGMQVERVEGIDFGAVFQIAAGPVRRVQNARDVLARDGKVGRPRCAGRARQTLLAHDPLDRGTRRGAMAQTEFLQLASNGASPDQSDFLAGQPTANLNDQALHPRRARHGRMRGATGLALETGPSQPLITSPPFGQPSATPVNVFEDDLGRGPSDPQAKSGTAQARFLFVVHVAS
jgi:hypothetical protein